MDRKGLSPLCQQGELADELLRELVGPIAAQKWNSSLQLRHSCLTLSTICLWVCMRACSSCPGRWDAAMMVAWQMCQAGRQVGRAYTLLPRVMMHGSL